MSEKPSTTKEHNKGGISKAELQFENLAEMLVLENTKVLQKGVMNLYKNYTAQQSEESIELKEFVKKEYQNCIDINKPYTFNSQNVYCDFFSFLHTFKTDSLIISKSHLSKDELIINKTVDFLQYCIDLMNAQKQEKVSVMYSYERIANDICALMNYEYCYFVYADKNGEKIVKTSDFYIKDKDGPENIRNLIYSVVKKHKKSKPDINLEETEETEFKISRNTICKFLIDENSIIEKGTKEASLLSICIDLFDNYNPKTRKSLYIVLANDEILMSHNKKAKISGISLKKDSILIKNSALVLSLRHYIKSAFTRDMAELLSMNYNNSFDDVSMINESGLKILHISDLHVDSYIKDKLIDKIKNSDLNKREKFDLLIISGDIIQAKSSAKELEDNYSAAADVIYEIAKMLWIESNKKLRSDWRKRIIIIPGNHDYAIMNELSAVQTKRALKYGYVSDKEGSTMVKFAYYINFIRQLLDVQLDHYIENNLNDFRYYKKLSLSVCCLNSCIHENPLRTNKVTLDAKWISSVIDQYSNEYSSICTVHHAPNYKIDYFIDKYNDINWSEMDNNLIRRLKNAVAEKKKSWMIYDDDGNNRKTEYEEKLKNISETMSKDYEEFLNTFNDPSVERQSRWTADTKFDMEMSINDQGYYKEQYKILNDKYDFIANLSGHEHKMYKEDNTFIQNTFFKIKKGAKPEDDSVVALQYGILELMNDTSEFDSKKYNKYQYIVRATGEKDKVFN